MATTSGTSRAVRVDPVIKAPPWWMRLGESRAWFEFQAFVASAPMLRLIGRGDRHPVLVLPGFTASDRSTEPLRWVLRSQGYLTHGWSLGRNMGPTPRVVDGIQARLLAIHERHGRAVSLVGWSLGGIYARELARRHPEAVRQVVTLGSPFRMTKGDRSSASAMAERVQSRWDTEALRLAEREDRRPPLPVPSTAIYSRTDGVVRWHTCIDVESEFHENIEVRGSHVGLGWNPAVVYAVSDRLAQPAGDWRRFSAPLALRGLYPRPASWLQAG